MTPAALLLPAALVATPAAPPQVTLPVDPLGPVSVNGTSLSTAAGGTLVGGAYLERDGEHHTGLAAHRGRDNRFGTVELVSLIRHAAARVEAEFPGTKLRVGNLSRRGGGDLPMSVSHNSGRDADLAFFSTDPAGRPDQPGGFLRFDSQGRSRKAGGRWRFDVARNWALVRALLSATEVPADVQFLFISHGLKALLLDHARTLGEAPELLARADKVLNQPTGSLPHDDHLHLRIYCPPDDLLDGCRDYGPTWAWVDDHSDLRRARARAVGAVLADPAAGPERKLRALALTEATRGVDATPWLLVAAGPGTPRSLRLRALDVLAAVRPDEVAWPLAALAVDEADADVAARTLDAVAAIGDPRTWPLVAALLGDGRAVAPLPELDPREPASARLRAVGRAPEHETLGERAARTLSALTAVDAIPALIDALGHPSAEQRRAAARALEMLTNQRVAATPWGRQGPEEARSRAGRAAWRRWWAAHRGQDRELWLAAGFEAAGGDLPKGAALVSDDCAPGLLKLLRSRRRHVAHNAREVLRQIAKLRPWRRGDPYLGEAWWLRWWATQRASTRKGRHGGADVGLRAILRAGEPVPVTTRSPPKMRRL